MEIVGAAASVDYLECLLKQVDTSFSYECIVSGLPFSARLFQRKPFEGSVSLLGSRSPLSLASQFFAPDEEFRHHPPLVVGMRKGWQVNRVLIHLRPTALVLATWC